MRVVVSGKLVGQINSLRGCLRRLMHHFQVFGKAVGRLLLGYPPLPTKTTPSYSFFKKSKNGFIGRWAPLRARGAAVV